MKIPTFKSNPAAGVIFDSLEHAGIKPAQAARDMKIPRISADTALRMQRYLGVPATLLMRLQTDFDLGCAAKKKVAKIEESVRRLEVA